MWNDFQLQFYYLEPGVALLSSLDCLLMVMPELLSVLRPRSPSILEATAYSCSASLMASHSNIWKTIAQEIIHQRQHTSSPPRGRQSPPSAQSNFPLSKTFTQQEQEILVAILQTRPHLNVYLKMTLSLLTFAILKMKSHILTLYGHSISDVKLCCTVIVYCITVNCN